MPFSEPPLSLTYFSDYLHRTSRALINAEWKLLDTSLYPQFALELNDAIERINILKYKINQLKIYENTQKTNL